MVYTNWVNFSMNHNNLWAIIEAHVHSLWVIYLSACCQINNICILNNFAYNNFAMAASPGAIYTVQFLHPFVSYFVIQNPILNSSKWEKPQ